MAAQEGATLRDEVIALKRERILQEAAKLFYERGYVQTTVDAVAERLGSTKPFVYYHFGSKIDLLVEICVRGTGDALAATDKVMQSQGSPPARLAEFMREFTAASLKNHRLVAIYFREEINLPPEATQRIGAMRKKIDSRLRSLLADGKNSGDFVIDDPKVTALIIEGMASYAFAWYREGTSLSEQRIVEQIVAASLKLVSSVSA